MRREELQEGRRGPVKEEKFFTDFDGVLRRAKRANGMDERAGGSMEEAWTDGRQRGKGRLQEVSCGFFTIRDDWQEGKKEIDSLIPHSFPPIIFLFCAFGGGDRVLSFASWHPSAVRPPRCTAGALGTGNEPPIGGGQKVTLLFPRSVDEEGFLGRSRSLSLSTPPLLFFSRSWSIH